MTTRVGRPNALVRNTLAAGIFLVILASVFGGIPVMQNAYAAEFNYVVNDELSCEALPLNKGKAVWHSGVSPVCEIPLLSDGSASFLRVGSGAILQSLTIDTDVTLLNRAIIEIVNSATFHILGTIDNRLTISIESGAVMIIHPSGSFSKNVRVLVDSNGGIINRGEILATDSGSTTGVSNAGHFFSDCNSSIINGPIFGNQPVDICGAGTGTIAQATNQATGQSMFAGGREFYGELFGFGSAVLFKTVDCVTVELRKHGSPTGLAEVGFYRQASFFPGKIFGTLDVSTLTTGYKAYEFCLPSSDESHLVLADDILAVKYSGGDSLNRIDVRRSNVGAGPDFDGLASYHVNEDNFWHLYNSPTQSRDLLFKLTNS